MKKSELTKQKILLSATTLFSRQGYSSTSTKDIATHAGFSEATIFKYFESKDNLFKHIVLELVKELKKISLYDILPILSSNYSDKPLYNMLSYLIDNRIYFLEQHDLTIKAIIQEAMINDTIKVMIQDEIWPAVSTNLSKVFNQAKKSKEIRDHQTMDLVTSFISTIITPILASYVSTSMNIDQRNQVIKNHFELFYNFIAL